MMVYTNNTSNQRQINEILRRPRLTVVAVVVVIAAIFTPNRCIHTSNATLTNGICDLECPTNIGAKCAFGESPHMLNDTMMPKSSTTQSQETSINGMHCSCPMDYTGIQCEFAYDSCNDDNQHVCYHGGECRVDAVDSFGNQQHYCDCYNAYDKINDRPYVGKYCELETVASCDDPIDPNSYCFNGGICNNRYPEYGSPCLCSGGHSGPRCEYTYGDNATIIDEGGNIVPQTNTLPCNLTCSNGGVCIHGNRTYADQSDEYLFWINEDNLHDNMYCNCTDTWDGPTCAIEKVVCGDHHCFHGATCLERTETDENNNPTVYHHCDCSVANNSDESYAGQFCQYKATEYCTKDPGLNGELFCVNHGKCRDNAFEGCDCPDGYKGFSCEFHISTPTNDSDNVEVVDESEQIAGRPTLDPVDSADCTMVCQHGGTCRHGKKSLGGGLDLFAGNTNYLNEEAGTSQDFQHCVCPYNYAGTNCEHAIDSGTGTSCEQGQHICMHGSKCVDYGNEQLCDCDSTDSPLATFFAGSHCEHPVNDVCTPMNPNTTTPSKVTFGDDVPGSVTAYCVNGGTCKDFVSESEPHPGCQCPDGFLGPHCELRESPEVANVRENDPYANQQVSNYDSGNDGLSGFIIFAMIFSLILVCITASYTAYEYKRRHKRRNEAITNTLKWSAQPNFRDGGSTEINIAPKRGSAQYSDDADDEIINISPYEDAIIRSSPSPTNHEELWSSTVATHVSAQDGVSLIDGQNSFIGSVVVDADDYDNNTAISHHVEDRYSLPQIDIGPPIDEDGHELHNVEIV